MASPGSVEAELGSGGASPSSGVVFSVVAVEPSMAAV